MSHVKEFRDSEFELVFLQISFEDSEKRKGILGVKKA